MINSSPAAHSLFMLISWLFSVERKEVDSMAFSWRNSCPCIWQSPFTLVLQYMNLLTAQTHCSAYCTEHIAGFRTWHIPKDVFFHQLAKTWGREVKTSSGNEVQVNQKLLQTPSTLSLMAGLYQTGCSLGQLWNGKVVSFWRVFSCFWSHAQWMN